MSPRREPAEAAETRARHTPVIVRRAFAGQPSEIIITWDGKTLQADEARKLIPLHDQAPAMREALRGLIEAEDRFAQQSGVPLSDDVSDRVEAARAILRSMDGV